MTRPWRETPLVESIPLSKAAGCRVFLKLENLQPSGSFKSRGVGNYLLSHLARSKPPTPESTNGTTTPDERHGAPPPRTSKAHFYCSSGGNAGLACATAAAQLDHPCTVVVPISTKQMMIDKIRAAGASDVIVHGASWQEADAHLRDDLLAKDPNGVYVPPFDHPDVWAGNATLVSEVARQLADLSGKGATPSGLGPDGLEDVAMYRTTSSAAEPPDAFICSVGGGGLFNGIMQGITSPALNPDVSSAARRWSATPVLAVETRGADSLAASLEARELVTIPAITSQATSLGARRVSAQTFKLASDPTLNVRSMVFTDAEAAGACVRFADEERVLVELACGVSAAVCYDEHKRLEKVLRSLGRWRGAETKVVLVVCGGSIVTLDMLQAWRAEQGLHVVAKEMNCNGLVLEI